MKRYRGNAIAVGLLLIACTAASILSAVPLGSMLDRADYLARLAGSENGVIWTALLEFTWAATGAGIALGLYPVIRTYGRGLALASVAGRVAEGVLVLVGTLSLLALFTLGQAASEPGANTAALGASGDTLLALREWAFGFVAMLPFLTGALLYYVVLYRSRLVPRWLSGWGVAGAALGLLATVYSGYTQGFGMSTAETLLYLPIGVQELVLAGWLLAKGFSPADDAAEGDRSRQPALEATS